MYSLGAHVGSSINLCGHTVKERKKTLPGPASGQIHSCVFNSLDVNVLQSPTFPSAVDQRTTQRDDTLEEASGKVYPFFYR